MVSSVLNSILEYYVYSGMDVPCLSGTLFVQSLPSFPFSKSTNLRRKSAACIGSGQLFDHSAGSEDASVLGTLSGGVDWVEITLAGEATNLATARLIWKTRDYRFFSCSHILEITGCMSKAGCHAFAVFGRIWEMIRQMRLPILRQILFASVSISSLLHDLLQNGSSLEKTTPCHVV